MSDHKESQLGLKIIKVKQTCCVCPSAYECVTENGQFLYMRFRGGHGTVRLFESPEKADEDWLSGRVIADFKHGHPLDGYLTIHQFCEIAGLELAEDAELNLMQDYDDNYEWDDNPPWAR